MLNPWIENSDQGPFYCPDCGIVEGFFYYNPDIKDKIEIISVDFERPRQKVIDLLGQENQGCPVLVLDNESPPSLDIKKSMSTGRMFIDDPIAICEFLTDRFNGTGPHPQ